ncbi:MAG: VOC family protein [Sphingobacteriales bacterium]|nr:MAG: VOC family protein [Sphingobacteriales bacterium]
MTSINPYLNFAGNAEEAFSFYKEVFGGNYTKLIRFGDLKEGQELSPADKQRIMHVALQIGEHAYLMGTDTLEAMGDGLAVGDHVFFYINADSQEEASRLFDSLAVGGDVTMPLEQALWGHCSGMVKDRFGIHWMVSFKKG